MKNHTLIQYHLHSHTVNMDEGLYTVAFNVRVVGNGRNDEFCFVGDYLNFIPDIGNAYGEYVSHLRCDEVFGSYVTLHCKVLYLLYRTEYRVRLYSILY